MGWSELLRRTGGEGAVYGKGISVARRFSREGINPYDEIAWERRDARITNEKGEVIFEQKDVEAPVFYSQTAVNIIASKYFRGKLDTPLRETSVRQLVDRVARTIGEWGRRGGYFAAPEDANTFVAELTAILVNQKAAFNSPVWFNMGVLPQPQCSACFINSVQDDMRSILNLAVTEGMLFKGGSGTGTNLSTLRSSREHLSQSSGKSSGPISFMKGFDAFAGVIKSGGKTRRAAKMVILNVEHPDIRDFIWCKAKEEKKAWALVDAGYDGTLNGEAYQSIFFQNANNSVRVSDEFMRAADSGGEWQTRSVTSGEPVETHQAKEILKEIAEAAWLCGDPGMQYDTVVNDWNPCIATARINASNPCSEYMFLDDSACNLSSLNLMRFRRPDGSFDVDAFRHAARIMITAMEIIVGNSSYPTPAIEQNSHDFRALGIGYANLGALLMSRGLAYDSEEGRNYATAITSLLSGEAYVQSAEIAAKLGAFRYFAENREPFLRVIGKHQGAARAAREDGVPVDLAAASRGAWEQALTLGQEHGFRNAQVSLLAPTGTIAFMMDCDTTGVEPDIALVKYKWLVGGGMLKIINNTVPEALKVLGYTEVQIREILDYIEKNDTIEGAPHLGEAHLPVFDCAFKPQKGKRFIQYMGHIRMMAAVQPFLSGAISKTVNLPSEATVEDVMDVYVQGWKLGLKAIAIYRDGSKRQQPLTLSNETDQSKSSRGKAEVAAPRRRRLPDERRSITHKFTIGSHEGYITVGLYDDGAPGELFIVMSKEGSSLSGLMDSFATSVSVGLQYGVPLRVLVNKFVHTRFEPSGYTQNPSIKIAKSIVDYIFRWLAMKFLSADDQVAVGIQLAATQASDALVPAPTAVGAAQPNLFAPGALGPVAIKSDEPQSKGANDLTMTWSNNADAPSCHNCGSIMVRNAACYKCLNCGETSGCS
ncbi:vitamin B12-dependent ribonucleotide reductase [Patescibacteria group bacterium]|nr:MAG: vitamin B12-dependent ribonucleotide reductase [Patescibacteria group bacterium]